MTRFFVFFICIFLGLNSSFAEGVKERFTRGNVIYYSVYFNAMRSGRLLWRYAGRQKVGDIDSEVLAMDSDAKLLAFLDLKGKEKVFINPGTGLPVKVERDLVTFGKKELIEEFYDQEKGEIRIINNGKIITLKQAIPVHNILALLYFFPKTSLPCQGEELSFNLPTQKIKIKMIGEREFIAGKEKRKAYFLIGRGAKRFNMWLDYNEFLPLRIEFILPVGKVTVVRRFDNPVDSGAESISGQNSTEKEGGD